VSTELIDVRALISRQVAPRARVETTKRSHP